MSLSSVIAFTLLFKKITRKASIGKKKRTDKRTMSTTVPSTNATPDTTSTNTSPLRNTVEADNHVSMNKELSSSSCSSSEIEELEELDDYENDLCNDMNRQSLINATASSINSPTASRIKVVPSDTTDAAAASNITGGSITELSIDCEPKKDDLILTPSKAMPHQEQQIGTHEGSMNQKDEASVVKIRDFAYPIDSPLHFGKQLTATTNESTKGSLTNLKNSSNISLSSPDFNGRDARALFDFVPETDYEVPLKAGQLIWVQYRQCPGWLIADVDDDTGLVPEAYVEFI